MGQPSNWLMHNPDTRGGDIGMSSGDVDGAPVVAVVYNDHFGHRPWVPAREKRLQAQRKLVQAIPSGDDDRHRRVAQRGAGKSGPSHQNLTIVDRWRQTVGMGECQSWSCGRGCACSLPNVSPNTAPRLAISVVCLGAGRVELAMKLIESRIVDELHLDYFPGGPLDSAGLRDAEVRDIALSETPATIHFWGSAADFSALDITPRRGLRVVVQVSDPTHLDAAAHLGELGWNAGWSVVADEWSSVLAWSEHRSPPDHIQVLSTTTPGWPGGTFSDLADDAAAHFAAGGAELSFDGGLTAEVAAGLVEVGTVVLGSNFLGANPTLETIQTLVEAFASHGRRPLGQSLNART